MSEQKENAQLEAYRKLVDDFKRFVSSEIRAEENSYRIVDMTSEDAEIDDPSVPVTQLEDEKAEKLAEQEAAAKAALEAEAAQSEEKPAEEA